MSFAMPLMREGLLGDRTVAVAGAVAAPVREALLALGARVEPMVGAEAAEPGGSPPSALLYDAAAAFGAGGDEGLRAALEQAWTAIRLLAADQLIPAGRGGQVVLVAPRPSAGPLAESARGALENLARTLSVEWARYAITATFIAPGRATSDDEVATLVCYLLSPAGAYFSGCRFELGTTSG